MVREGETYEHEGIKVVIMEVIPYKRFSGKKELLVAYKLIDGEYESPVAHFWMGEHEDIRKIIRDIVNYYLKIKPVLRRSV